jgi:hypothetical protein
MQHLGKFSIHLVLFLKSPQIAVLFIIDHGGPYATRSAFFTHRSRMATNIIRGSDSRSAFCSAALVPGKNQSN